MELPQSQPARGEPQSNAQLTTGCYYVQGELLNLAAALDAESLAADPAAATSRLAAVRECRRQLRDHIQAMEAPAGLYDYLESDSAAMTSELGSLCAEHCELDRRLEALERLLETFDPADPNAVPAIRHAARQLTELTCDHRRHVSDIERQCAGSPTPNAS